jgi:hypothetical protein
MNDLTTLLATYAPTRPAIRLTHRGACFAVVSRPDVGPLTWAVYTDDVDEDDDRPIGFVVDVGLSATPRHRRDRHRWRVLPVCGVHEPKTCASLRHAVAVVYAHRRAPLPTCAAARFALHLHAGVACG